MAGAAHVTKLTNPSIMPRLWNGALSRMMLVSSGRETPVPSAMISRAASSIGKFNASAPTSVPTENSAMAITNNALVGNLRTMNGDVGMATESNSRYPVVSHCTTSAEIANSSINAEYAMFSEVSDRMPRKVRMASATTTMVSLPSLIHLSLIAPLCAPLVAETVPFSACSMGMSDGAFLLPVDTLLLR